MLAVWEDGHLVQVFGEPRCTLRNGDKAVFDHRGLRVQPHDLLAVRLIAGDTVAAVGDQFLDQLADVVGAPPTPARPGHGRAAVQHPDRGVRD
jgi:hypothetical protein